MVGPQYGTIPLEDLPVTWWQVLHTLEVVSVYLEWNINTFRVRPPACRVLTSTTEDLKCLVQQPGI